jgi:hypothetical protein
MRSARFAAQEQPLFVSRCRGSIGLGSGGLVPLDLPAVKARLRSIFASFGRQKPEVAPEFPGGLFQDLRPDFSFIVPNQCHDQHGRDNAGPFYNFDENDNGTQTGLNDALILQVDVTVTRVLRVDSPTPTSPFFARLSRLSICRA